MKTFLSIVISIVIFIGCVNLILYADEKPPVPQKEFTVTYTVTYNSVTLEEASKLEMQIKKENKDACTVDVTVKEISTLTTTSYITNGSVIGSSR